MTDSGALDFLLTALLTLPPPQRRHAAHRLRRLAQALDVSAERDDALLAERERFRTAREAAPRLYARARRSGLDHTPALNQVARDLDASAAFVAAHVARAERQRARADDAARTIEIVKLARAGYTNRAIAKKIGLSAATVGRRLRKALEAAQSAGTAPGAPSGRLSLPHEAGRPSAAVHGRLRPLARSSGRSD